MVPLKKIVPVLVAALLTSACGGAGEAESKASPKPKPLEQAKTKCGVSSDAAKVGDGGKTLTIDGKGKKDFAGLGLEISDVSCILKALNVSDAVISQMDSTRALDGRQSAEWEGYSASWTYHPDAGLDIIVTQKS